MAVACSMGHTLALAERGLHVFAFGRNTFGQLGIGTREHQRTPVPMVGLEGLPDVVMVVTGYHYSAAITSTGRLLLLGENGGGQLGQGDQEDRLVPVMLGPPHFGGAKVAMVACGDRHTLVVTSSGLLFAFGFGGDGQLGLGDRNSRDVPVEVGPERFGGAIIAYAGAGATNSGVVTACGAVWTWGCGRSGRLGHNGEQDELVPRELQGQFGGARALSLAAGVVHTMVVTTCGAVWACGFGESGLLGVGDRADRHVPVRVGGEEVFGHSKVRMVACGTGHTVAVTEEGAVWSWGCGFHGMLGHNDDRDRLVPARVGQEWFGGAKIVTADCSGSHSAAVSEDGSLFTWGSSAQDCAPAGLGHDDLEVKFMPTLVAPDRLLGARIGRDLELAPAFALAFAMGTHARLSAGAAAAQQVNSTQTTRKVPRMSETDFSMRGTSVVLALAGEPGLIKMIVGFARDSAFVA